MRLFRLLAVMSASLAVAATCAAQAPSSAPTTTFTTITDFGEGDGQYPNAPLSQGTDGNFYGTTQRGGTNRNGIVFKIAPTGSTTNLYSFCSLPGCEDGKLPYSGLILGGDGNFYGTNSHSGDGIHRTVNYGGTVFTIGPQTSFSVVYSFCSDLGCQDGANPYSAVTLGSDGNLYGTTGEGGSHNLGTVFVMTPQGAENVLYSPSSVDGVYGGLLQATDGNLYGSTYDGGTGASCATYGCGTIFKITPHGALTTIYAFCSLPNCTDGYLGGQMIQAADGNLYGVAGGAGGPGSIFKLTTSGVLTTLYTFCSLDNCADGRGPSQLVQATDGNFYGATYDGGSGSTCYQSVYACGTLFKLTPGGALTTLYDFCPSGGQSCPDGRGPGTLTQGTDGNFYGVADGGATGLGTAFKLSVGLGPFIQTVTSSGKAGSSVIVLGNDLTGATSVTFNGTSAAFTIVSSTEITATVPKGATTGAVVVTTPGGTLNSNKNFQVTT
jgi:uncharacterized repeat protein (TIGR03803 family)